MGSNYEKAVKLFQEGKDGFCFLEASAKERIEQYKQAGFGKVQILCADDACSKCIKQNGKVFTLEEALKEMPIPCKECVIDKNEIGKTKRGFCRCDYMPLEEKSF